MEFSNEDSSPKNAPCNLKTDWIPWVASLAKNYLSSFTLNLQRHKPNTSSSPANYYLSRRHNSITFIFHPPSSKEWREGRGEASDRDGRPRKPPPRFERRKVHFWGANFCKTCDAERPYYDKSRLSNTLPQVAGSPPGFVFDLQSPHRPGNLIQRKKKELRVVRSHAIRFSSGRASTPPSFPSTLNGLKAARR